MRRTENQDTRPGFPEPLFFNGVVAIFCVGVGRSRSTSPRENRGVECVALAAAGLLNCFDSTIEVQREMGVNRIGQDCYDKFRVLAIIEWIFDRSRGRRGVGIISERLAESLDGAVEIVL